MYVHAFPCFTLEPNATVHSPLVVRKRRVLHSAQNQQIRRLKQVGRTTKNSRLLLTTCLVQMVMGPRGQPREFIRETYVYVESATMWMFVVALLVLMVLYLQFVSIYDWE